jgi:competence protein ComEC
MLRAAGLVTLVAIIGAGCDKRGSGKSAVTDLPATAVGAERAPPGAKKPAGTDDTDAMRLHFIDVGQGDATLIEFPCGVALIDTGGELNEQFDSTQSFQRYLAEFFAAHAEYENTIDLLVITHPHIDHTRSLEHVLETYRVRNVLDNGQVVDDDPGTPPQQAMHSWLEEASDVGHHDVMAAEIPVPGGWNDAVIDPFVACERAATDPRITALWGQVDDHDQTYGQNPNDHSVVLRVDYGKSSALFTGDLQMMGLARMSKHFAANPEIFDVDVYQVGHHGSHNATKPYFVELMSPQFAVVSMGPYERNLDWTARRYGHPHRKALGPLLDPKAGVSGWRAEPIETMIGVRGAWKETPEEFEAAAISRGVYATGWDGTIVLTGNANGWIEVATEKGPG